MLRARRCMWLSGFGVGIRLTLSIYRGSDTTDATQESGDSLGADNVCVTGDELPLAIASHPDIRIASQTGLSRPWSIPIGFDGFFSHYNRRLSLELNHLYFADE